MTLIALVDSKWGIAKGGNQICRIPEDTMVWIERIGGRTPDDCGFAFVNSKDCLCRTTDGCNAFFELYRVSWLAYRRKPEEAMRNA